MSAVRKYFRDEKRDNYGIVQYARQGTCRVLLDLGQSCVYTVHIHAFQPIAQFQRMFPRAHTHTPHSLTFSLPTLASAAASPLAGCTPCHERSAGDKNPQGNTVNFLNNTDF